MIPKGIIITGEQGGGKTTLFEMLIKSGMLGNWGIYRLIQISDQPKYPTETNFWDGVCIDDASIDDMHFLDEFIDRWGARFFIITTYLPYKEIPYALKRGHVIHLHATRP